MHLKSDSTTSWSPSIASASSRPSRRILDRFIDSAVWLIPSAGFLVGFVAATFFLFGLLPGLTAWFDDSKGWELNAFDAFGTMSGFSLASLALVASLRGHEYAREILDSNPGRFLIRMLVRSTITWFIAAGIALISVVVQASSLRALLIVVTALALAQGALALFALERFFQRFSRRKSWD